MKDEAQGKENSGLHVVIKDKLRASMTDWAISSNGYCKEELGNEGAYLYTKSLLTTSDGHFYCIIDIFHYFW